MTIGSKMQLRNNAALRRQGCAPARGQPGYIVTVASRDPVRHDVNVVLPDGHEIIVPCEWLTAVDAPP